MSAWLIALIVIGALILSAISWFVGIYNRLVKSKALLDEGWSGIDVQLKRRYDLIPNLVKVVKQYGFHEKDVLEKVTKLRSVAMGSQDLEGRVAAETGLTSALKTLFAVSENYPDLKANKNFLALQEQLSAIENDVQLARRYYNGTARNYNVVVKEFPSRFVANMTGYIKAPYFEVDAPEERKSPDVKF